MKTDNSKNNIGKITQIVGPVVDVYFPYETPQIYDAISVNDLVLEVEHILGDGHVRAVAMGQTEGLKLGLPVVNSGKPITVPTGNVTLGRIFDVLDIQSTKRAMLEVVQSIHQFIKKRLFIKI